MKILLHNTPELLGEHAARLTAGRLNRAIQNNGGARLLMATGASQFTTIQALTRQLVDWAKVEMFHLDEYMGLDASHPASFVRYLKDRFVSKVNLKAAHFIDTAMDTECLIRELTAKLEQAPVDVGLIGIGENGHIAFNDPPADFTCPASYKVVTLDEACRRQQLGEGWFPTLSDVPARAHSMTVQQMMKCKSIVSAVPFAVKAKAVHDTLIYDVTPTIPATILKTHPDFTLLLDRDSASLVNPERLAEWGAE